MANYGPAGNAKGILPFDPVPRRKTLETFDEKCLDELGISSPSDVRTCAYEEFSRVAGEAPDAVLTEEHFIAAAAQLWAMGQHSARACFHAADMDGSGRMNRHEYLVFREAFVHEAPPEMGLHAEIVKLRMRALFYKYVLGHTRLNYYADVTISSDSLFELVRDICASDAHVQLVADKLMPLLVQEGTADGEAQNGSTAGASLDINKFVEILSSTAFRDKMRELGITRDEVSEFLVKPKNAETSHYPRAVVDGRTETACVRAPLRAQLSLASTTGSQYVRHSSGAIRTNVSSREIEAEALSAEMELDPQVRAVGGWRGPLAPGRGTQEYQLAMRVVERAMSLARKLPLQADMLDKYWLPRQGALRLLLGVGEEHQANCVKVLARACQRQLQAQPSVVRVAAPAKIFGDVHGQLRDLLLMFGLYGAPTHCGGDIQTTSYVFNGDWVDRGEHQLEVVLLLFSLKIVYPAHVFLVRGNHEFRDMSEGMEEDGFLWHMEQRLPSCWNGCYEALHEAFDWLPLAALVGGLVLVLHGGIGDGSWGVKDLERVRRPLQFELEGCVLDALWSDPTDSDDWMYFGVHSNESRGLGSGVAEFGPDVTAEFCKREGLSIIVRSHQYVRQGYKVMHGGHLITLFTARNYFGEVGQESNDGAMLLVAPDVNGHLRVHPKRLMKLELESGSWRSWLTKWMPCLGPCVYGFRHRI